MIRIDIMLTKYNIVYFKENYIYIYINSRDGQ